MTHSVVLLDGETGGFIVAGGSIKPIPKIGNGLRRHLLAVNTLAQALEGEDLMQAVSRGAAYYGLARRGRGVRIRGGTARTYYIGVAHNSATTTLTGAYSVRVTTQ